jgi:hypothetical protein
MTDSPRTYRFGPLERHSLLGPLRAGQAGMVVALALLALGLLHAAPGNLGVAFALIVFGSGAALTLIPLGSRGADEWVTVLIVFAARRLGGGGRWRSRAPRAGTIVEGRRQPRWPELALPPALRGVELGELNYRHGQIGVLREPHRHRLTAVIACKASAFALLDPEAQERRLELWGGLLAGTSQTPIRRLQWLERTAPAHADELTRWLHEARDPQIPPRGAPIVESYLELISAGTSVAHGHEILLAIQIGASRGSHRVRDAETTLLDQIERIARSLSGAEVTVLGALTPGPLARALRVAFDPYAGAELRLASGPAAGVGGGASQPSVAPHEAGPVGAVEHWDHYRCDGALHATFWIAAWPHVEVLPMFLDPLLGDSRVVRTIAVTMQPIAPERSTREVEAAITRDHADSELRRRFGQGETARHRQAQEAARRREAELAAGHCEMRLAGFVTVSGRDQRELSFACNELHQQAARAHLRLHRLYGQQAEAFTFTLPLARGLR